MLKAQDVPEAGPSFPSLSSWWKKLWCKESQVSDGWSQAQPTYVFSEATCGETKGPTLCRTHTGLRGERESAQAGHSGCNVQNGRAVSFQALSWATSPPSSEWPPPFLSDPTGHLLEGHLALAWCVPDRLGRWPAPHVLSARAFST